MSWMFCYYVESRYGYLYRDPAPWFNVDIVAANCPSAFFHCSETHIIHKLGGYLKNFGLRTCLIIETPREDEAVMLRLLGDQLINHNHGTKSRAPVLQLILENPDWNALEDVCQPLEAYKRLEGKRKDEIRATNLLQKQIDRITTTVEDLDGVVGDEYRDQTAKFIEASHSEIERIRSDGRASARTATSARRTLTRKLLSYSSYSLSPNLK
jgi:hypothetical protein